MKLLATHAIEIWRYLENDLSSAKGYFHKGEWVEPERGRLVTSGTMYPYQRGKDGGKTKVTTQDFEYTSDMVWVLTTQQLFVVDSLRDIDADHVMVDGMAYEVVQTQDWRILRQTRHFRNLCRRRPDLDGAYCNDKC
jgi:hypothetical protein